MSSLSWLDYYIKRWTLLFQYPQLRAALYVEKGKGDTPKACGKRNKGKKEKEKKERKKKKENYQNTI